MLKLRAVAASRSQRTGRGGAVNEQRATVDCRDGQLIVASYSKTVPGFWVMNGSFEILPVEVDSARLGAAVDAALEHSGHEFPSPDPSYRPITPVLDALGLRSFAAYLKGATSADVARTGLITFRSTHNAGTRTGFVEIEGAEFDVASDATHDEIGQATRRALAGAT